MGDKTGISWTDATWNPTKGCSRTIAAGAAQSGCGDNTGGGCYAEQQAGRIVRMAKGKPCAYDGLVRLTAKGWRWTGEVRLVPEVLAWPLTKREPIRIFVDSMSDLFHEKLSNEQIAAVFGVITAAPRHTFQVLTKRAERMREWFEWINEHHYPTPGVAFDSNSHARRIVQRAAMQLMRRPNGEAIEVFPAIADWRWPLPNVWLGVSVENQEAADERVPELLRTPAAVRFLSCEPLLGEVDLLKASPNERSLAEDLDWIIAGCESGPGARPCSVEWLRSLRDQCASAGVAFFLKQAIGCCDPTTPDKGHSSHIHFGPGARRKPGGVIELPYLDGVQHAAFPEASR